MIILESKSQVWRDLIGYCTRYGDVRELLEKIDDRYVIMNAGDEMALRFAVPEGPPPGWKPRLRMGFRRLGEGR